MNFGTYGIFQIWGDEECVKRHGKDLGARV
jgi:hypothetical protein